MSVLFFKPVPRPAIWGHTLVKDYFGYHDFPEGIGQAWAFSAQKEASTICISDPYKGQSLLDLWNNHQELFHHQGEEFPVIISLVAPEDDLSIQVHPATPIAHQLGYKMGKNEAWYFIESKPGSQIVYGHHAKNEDDLYNNYINKNRWEELIKHLDVHTGDFVYLPAGILHAMKKGSIVYEIQQATDVTFRFYDYHRKDAQGNERPLHLKQAVACLSYDSKKMINDIHPVETSLENGKQTVFISNDSFTVTRLEITGINHLQYDNYELATVVKGKGKVNGQELRLGDSFLVPYQEEFVVEGNLTIMMTTR
ncbi:type I phosphomannose isomerase catalytic subunit [Sharpea azabuensis]|uniref:type I phosphomannose isomerase catalytic subunit n=1 Tax=Sharpea azabuensis TaxID=322505 RepID=UPI00240A9AE1|nr:type I phosphomannose isomerase catalytic subunit [Sharpea azabuensis]MDD6513658.1 mannose-6-phosphate isomerase [Sharpea azabuensis]